MRFSRLLLLSTLLSFRASAFDIYPEYQGLSAQDAVRIERPADLDEEYQSYLLAYQPSLAWDRWYLTQSRAIDTTVGSLTNQHFLIYTRGKFQASLNERLSFHFVYFAQRDREIDQVRQIFEVRYLLFPGWQVAAYIDPSLYKRENDAGLALLAELPSAQTRVFFTAHDFTRNEHNDQPDFFAKSPLSFGFVESITHDSFWSRFGGRFDTEVDWRRPQESRSVHYRKDLAFGDLRWEQDARRALNLRVQWDQTLKAADPGESWEQKRWQILLVEELGLETEPLAFDLGAMYASRHWLTTGGAQVDHQNVMPHAVFKIRTLRREDAFDHFRLGLTATDFHSWGPETLIPRDQKRDTVQGRLDARYEWSFANDARLAASLSFDLDEYSPTPTFEGGNVWFRTGF